MKFVSLMLLFVSLANLSAKELTSKEQAKILNRYLTSSQQSQRQYLSQLKRAGMSRIELQQTEQRLKQEQPVRRNSTVWHSKQKQKQK